MYRKTKYAFNFVEKKKQWINHYTQFFSQVSTTSELSKILEVGAMQSRKFSK